MQVALHRKAFRLFSLKTPGGTLSSYTQTTLSIHINEKHFIERTQDGEPQAFNPLVVKYQSKIHTFIKKQVKDTETAKDLTQETWIKAFRAINTFRADASFYSWLYRIAENVCIDFFRKQKAAYDIAPLHTVVETQIAKTYPDPGELLTRSELRQYLHDAIAALTPSRKRVFLLYYFEELSIKAIATHTGRSEGTVKTHLRNARLQLREHLTPYLKNHRIPWLA